MSHAGLVLLRMMAGLTGGLSRALATQLLLLHDGPRAGRPGRRDRGRRG
jgi:hypothetical protein